MKAFLDRAFYVASSNKYMFRHKVGAAVAATFEQLNNYINYSEMLMTTSNYCHVIYGTVLGDAKKCEEGAQIMRTLGKKTWLMKLVEYGKGKIDEPEKENKKENKVYTDFIRC